MLVVEMAQTLLCAQINLIHWMKDCNGYFVIVEMNLKANKSI